MGEELLVTYNRLKHNSVNDTTAKILSHSVERISRRMRSLQLSKERVMIPFAPLHHLLFLEYLLMMLRAFRDFGSALLYKQRSCRLCPHKKWMVGSSSGA